MSALRIQEDRKALRKLYAFAWVAAVQLGFTDRKHASRVLRRLKGRGLVESAPSQLWRLTDLGRTEIERIEALS